MKSAIGKANLAVKKLDADTAKRTAFRSEDRIRARVSETQPTLTAKVRADLARLRTSNKANRAVAVRGTPAISRVQGRVSREQPKIPNFTTGPIKSDKKVPTLKRRIKTGRR